MVGMPGQQPHRPLAQHRPAAILAADAVGYTRLMEADEQGTHDRLMHLRFSVLEPIIALA